MKYLILPVLLFIIISCEPAVVFKDAMPPEVEAIATIPDHFPRSIYV